jgi:iron complex outermembrane receptor protein
MSNRLLAQALASAGLLSIAHAALAQTPTAESAPQKVDKIEVTGSSLKRIEGEGSLPVTVITKADIEKSGATTPMELLQLVSSNNSLGNVSLGNVIGSTTFSAQTASLRGLGGGRTLVLINGKRVDGFAGEQNGVQGVNLAAIPFSAVERVEVLKDGASAVYGSDAVGGVINFILKSDYRGAEATVYYGAPTRSGGGKQGRVSLAAGMGDLAKDKYNLLMTLSFNDQKHLEQRDRDFSKSSYIEAIGLNGTSSNTFPANITTGGIGLINFPTGGPASIAAPGNCSPSTFYGGRCRFDPSNYPGVQMIPDDRLTNFFASSRFRFSESVEAYATLTASKNETNYKIQPVPISNLFTYGPDSDIPMTVTLPVNSPFYPTALAAAAGVAGQPLNIRYRAVENGVRDTTDTNSNTRVTAGIKGDAAGWDWDAGLHYSKGKTVSHINGGFPLTTKILPLLNSGTVNLFGPNSPAVVAQLRATNFIGDTFVGESVNSGVQAKATRELWTLPGGNMAIAFGGEARRETVKQVPNAVLSTGDISGFGGAVKDVDASRDVKALFAELNVPVLKTLDANFAIRNDRYSDFGSTTNPKVSLRWQPTKSVLMRGSYGKGFLAPSLFQLYSPITATVTPAGTSDPVRCPVTRDAGFDCDTQFGVTTGGNANLKPEKSKQATLGFVIEPSASWSFAADYFRIHLNDAITTGLPVATILGDLAQYGNLVTRAPSTAPFPNLPGRILRIDGRNINIGAFKVEGIDLETHWKIGKFDFGKLDFDASGTYYVKNDVQNTDGSFSGFVSNQFGSPLSGVLPRWKHYATLSWEKGPWSSTIGTQFQSGYVDVNVDGDDNLRRVSSMTLWDLQVAYRGIRGLTLTLGAKNIFDTNPPVTNQQTTFQVGFDPSYYDARARFVYLNATYSFR